jgi:cellobiose-specific phosphotransferase system component IIC
MVRGEPLGSCSPGEKGRGADVPLVRWLGGRCLMTALLASLVLTWAIPWRRRKTTLFHLPTRAPRRQVRAAHERSSIGNLRKGGTHLILDQHG